jgi:GNAT superfamily N-acetyltransferase
VAKTTAVRTHLELAGIEALRPAQCPDPRARVDRIEQCPASFFRYLYSEVGRGLSWTDRENWTIEQNAARLAEPGVFVHLLTVAAAPAGYFELEWHGDTGPVDIAYFGLLPEFHGKGLGKYLLTRAAEEALALAPGPVRLHTCTLDSPAALPNYLARGFRKVREETYTADVEG